MDIQTDKIYIVHYAPLYQRKEYLEEQFKKYGIVNYEFFEEFNRNTTSDEIINKYYKYDSSIGLLNRTGRCITIAHIELYKKIVEGNYDSVLILEDDAILFDNFLNNFGKYMKCVPKDYDLLFINAGCNLHAHPTKPEQTWYKVPATRTCCAYVITKRACEKLLPNIVPFSHSIDHILGKHFHSLNLNVYWCEPNLIGDGSESTYGVSYPK